MFGQLKSWSASWMQWQSLHDASCLALRELERSEWNFQQGYVGFARYIQYKKIVIHLLKQESASQYLQTFQLHYYTIDYQIIKQRFWDLQDRMCLYLLFATLSSFFLPTAPNSMAEGWREVVRLGTFEIGLDKLDAISCFASPCTWGGYTDVKTALAEKADSWFAGLLGKSESKIKVFFLLR